MYNVIGIFKGDKYLYEYIDGMDLGAQVTVEVVVGV